MAHKPTPDIDEEADPQPAHGGLFVPDDFVPRQPPSTKGFWLEPLGLEHNVSDYEAWTSSIDHIHATPGFASKRWPHPMTLDENASDLARHADHYARRLGFTYTVRSTDRSQISGRDVIGCVYIYPSSDPQMDALVRSWVRASHAERDVELWRTVSAWLAADWPFTTIDYAAR